MTYFQVESPKEVAREETLRKSPSHLPGKNSSILTLLSSQAAHASLLGIVAQQCAVWSDASSPGVSAVWLWIQLRTRFAPLTPISGANSQYKERQNSFLGPVVKKNAHHIQGKWNDYPHLEDRAVRWNLTTSECDLKSVDSGAFGHPFLFTLLSVYSLLLQIFLETNTLPGDTVQAHPRTFDSLPHSPSWILGNSFGKAPIC